MSVEDAPRETAYSYDPLYLEHDLPDHPESRARLESILRTLTDQGLLARMALVTPQPASLSQLGRVHKAAYIETVRRLAEHGGGFLDADTYVGSRSFDAARLAAGGVIALVRSVATGHTTNGIALVRPPGHHATSEQGMGFCLFNNVAVAAQAALDEYGFTRVLIIDWDVHHGNGTQDIFYDSPHVLFFSTHQYPHYPGSGHWRETGTGAGIGATVNVPLPAGVGDQGFTRIYDEVLTPIAERFRPELILVSAGYDAHWGDPLAGLRLSLAGYGRLAQTVVGLADRLCGGRLVVTLEGGYHLRVLATGIANTCRALLGDPGPLADPLGPASWPEPAIDRLLTQVKQAHRL